MRPLAAAAGAPHGSRRSPWIKIQTQQSVRFSPLESVRFSSRVDKRDRTRVTNRTKAHLTRQGVLEVQPGPSDSGGGEGATSAAENLARPSG